MIRTLRRWFWRLAGIVLCATSWLIAMGIYSLGVDWFLDDYQITGIEELLIYGVVDFTGQIGGVVLFSLGGPFLLWLFWDT
ncbi:hypothetical protein V8J82_11680 [Gymnodinialimonas sp. 2305UL16-5]|uniref:hypothetical protein n=1 Tax=Gymnodinialimonas mytili TaxID=3126503 RepID=UPI0030B5E393